MHSDRRKPVLGTATNNSPYALYYNLLDEIVVVRFQSADCDSDVGQFGIGWNVPIGTVTDIGVIPKRDYRKERYLLGPDFKTEDVNAGFLYYSNEKSGLTVETFNGTVTLVTYSPAKKEGDLRCPRVQECCVDFFPVFDEYSNLAFEDEKARLDITSYRCASGWVAGQLWCTVRTPRPEIES